MAELEQNIITEDYVSFEIAKLLKENGFNCWCDCCYAYFEDDDIRVFSLGSKCQAQSLRKDRYPYATQQMAMKWLRKKGIYIQIRRNVNTYLYGAIIFKDGTKIYSTISFVLETYEEAVDAALKYSLENLI